MAVHSYKDLPTARPDGLVIAAVPERADPRDALVSRDGSTLAELPAGAVVGTSSPRRSAQTLAVRPDLALRAIRGNVETRLEKVDTGEYDAALFAIAGLERLGLAERASHVFGFEEMLPAPAQGALAVECRRDDAETLRLLGAIDDRKQRQLVAGGTVVPGRARGRVQLSRRRLRGELWHDAEAARPGRARGRHRAVEGGGAGRGRARAGASARTRAAGDRRAAWGVRVYPTRTMTASP